jgi:hypothetical protein
MAIPEFLSGSDRNVYDPIEIRYGRVEEVDTGSTEPGAYAIDVTPSFVALRMNEVGGIKAVNGSQLIIDPEAGAEERGFRFLVAGIGLGFILHQRGISSLHASAVRVQDQAVAFIGWKGMGKSTTAAAFHQAGFSVITDDVLPLDLNPDTVHVWPAFPHLKLLPQSVTSVFQEDPDAHPRLDPQGEKRSRSVRRGFPSKALPLQCIYVLDWAKDNCSAVQIDPLHGQDACIELLRHTFALRMLQQSAPTHDQLAFMSQVASRVHVRRLIRPVNLDQVATLPEVIVEDTAQVHENRVYK